MTHTCLTPNLPEACWGSVWWRVSLGAQVLQVKQTNWYNTWIFFASTSGTIERRLSWFKFFPTEIKWINMNHVSMLGLLGSLSSVFSDVTTYVWISNLVLGQDLANENSSFFAVEEETFRPPQKKQRPNFSGSSGAGFTPASLTCHPFHCFRCQVPSDRVDPGPSRYPESWQKGPSPFHCDENLEDWKIEVTDFQFWKKPGKSAFELGCNKSIWIIFFPIKHWNTLFSTKNLECHQPCLRCEGSGAPMARQSLERFVSKNCAINVTNLLSLEQGPLKTWGNYGNLILVRCFFSSNIYFLIHASSTSFVSHKRMVRYPCTRRQF